MKNKRFIQNIKRILGEKVFILDSDKNIKHILLIIGYDLEEKKVTAYIISSDAGYSGWTDGGEILHFTNRGRDVENGYCNILRAKDIIEDSNGRFTLLFP